MDTCIICNGIQDSQQFEGYNICTECADIMEDLMSEYFLRTIRFESSNGYLKYLRNGKQYISDYKRIRRHSKRHIKHIEEHLNNELEKGASGGKKRYLERLCLILDWLEKTPEFYNYYFKKYNVCSECGASIFENYDKEKVGDWLIITCNRCDNVIKKYFSPKFTD